ncbi:MAG: hypothetical protein JRJ20_10760 [Deltaproteobacteria bacterium]|nr:hypothetical protein [Deltaproteobacteria bacterium]
MAEEAERHSLFLYLEDRFGIPERLFDEYLLFRRERSWSLMKHAPQIALAAQLKVSKVGIKAFQKVGAFVKPTTRMIQTFGHTATRARVEVDEKQLQNLLADEALPMDLSLEKGYVILSLGKDFILGAGFYGQGKVRSQLPRKEFRREMFQMRSGECGMRKPENGEHC